MVLSGIASVLRAFHLQEALSEDTVMYNADPIHDAPAGIRLEVSADNANVEFRSPTPQHYKKTGNSTNPCADLVVSSDSMTSKTWIARASEMSEMSGSKRWVKGQEEKPFGPSPARA